VSGVAEAIGLVPVVAPAVAEDEGAVLEGLMVCAAPAAAGPMVEEPAPGAAERVGGGVVAVAGVAGARCTVVPGADPGDPVAGIGVVEDDGWLVPRLSVVLPAPAVGVGPSREMTGGVGADDVVSAGVVAAGSVAAGMVAVRGGAAEVRGRRCTAAGPPFGDVADGLVAEVVDPPEVEVLDPVASLDVFDVLSVVELPAVVGPLEVLGGVDELAGRGDAELRLGVVLCVAWPAGEVGGCCGE
jgi:hypothetical protein